MEEGNDINRQRIKKEAKRVAKSINTTSIEDRAFMLGLVAVNLNEMGDPLGALFARIASTYKQRTDG